MNLAFGNKAAVAVNLTPGPSPRGRGERMLCGSTKRKRAPSPAEAGRSARCAVRKKGREAAGAI